MNSIKSKSVAVYDWFFETKAGFWITVVTSMLISFSLVFWSDKTHPLTRLERHEFDLYAHGKPDGSDIIQGIFGVLIASQMMLAFKRSRPALYGAIEVIVALWAGGTVVAHSRIADNDAYLKLAAAIYIAIRGYENMSKASEIKSNQALSAPDAIHAVSDVGTRPLSRRCVVSHTHRNIHRSSRQRAGYN